MASSKIQTGEISKYDIVIITGASSGIGEAFAEFALGAFERTGRRGFVYNLSRTAAKFDGRENFASITCDLSDSRALSAAAARIKERAAALGRPKILLINNAGFGAYGTFPKPNAARNLQMIDLNVRALTALTAEFLPEISAHGGAVINIASTAAFQACPYLGVYAATKAYVKSFTLALAHELRGKAKCLCVCPGPTSSKFFKAAGFDEAPLPAGFGHKPPDVVSAALKALAKDSKIVVVGRLNKLQALVVSLVPARPLLWCSGKILGRIRKI